MTPSSAHASRGNSGGGLDGAALRALGSACDVLEGDACRAYTVQGMAPRAVARPSDVESVSSVLRVASERRLAVTPWGGGGHQDLGLAPRRLDVVLSLERLARILLHEPADLTVSVEAGITHARLSGSLAAARQILPLDAPAPETSTVGGAIAAGTDGVRAGRYGLIRDLLIGARVVQADGTVWKSGGMVVKNVSGYDLHKLLVGSLGALGVIVEANFKVLPRPMVDRTLLLRGLSGAQAKDLAARIRGSPLEPSSVAMFDGLGAESPWRADPSSAVRDLAIRCEGRQESVARHLRDLCRYAGDAGAAEPITLDDGAAAAFWGRAARLWHGAARDPEAPHAALRLGGNPSGIAAAVDELVRDASRSDLDCTWMADLARDVVVAHLRPRRDGDAWIPALSGVWHRLATRRGQAVMLRVRPISPDIPDVWGATPSGIGIMRRLKEAFDPHAVLNAGRCAGGL